MTEKEIEQMLVKAVEKVGGKCPKWVAPGINGMPDRIVLLPDGKISFVEVKAPGCKPRKLQLRRHLELRHLGFRVYVLDDPREIDEIIKETKEDVE